MIRSSAVHTEDGEHLGAGVYESFLLPAGASFELFKQAVLAVYSSVDTERAKNYRKEIGFTGQEEMGVIIQEWKDTESGDATLGYLNTVRKNIPEVMEVTFQNRSIPEFNPSTTNQIDDAKAENLILKRTAILSYLYGEIGNDQRYFLLPLDHTRSDSYYKDAPALSGLALFLEQYLHKPLQIEFVLELHSLHFVQARPLPTPWVTPAAVTFPNQDDYLWRARSLGVMDEVLDILPSDPANNAK